MYGNFEREQQTYSKIINNLLIKSIHNFRATRSSCLSSSTPQKPNHRWCGQDYISCDLSFRAKSVLERDSLCKNSLTNTHPAPDLSSRISFRRDRPRDLLPHFPAQWNVKINCINISWSMISKKTLKVFFSLSHVFAEMKGIFRD